MLMEADLSGCNYRHAQLARCSAEVRPQQHGIKSLLDGERRSI
jgi:hypothetical protein